MEIKNFGAWTRRRVGFLVGGLAATLIESLADQNAAAKKRGKKKRKDRCRKVGQTCKKAKECCRKRADAPEASCNRNVTDLPPICVRPDCLGTGIFGCSVDSDCCGGVCGLNDQCV